MYVDEHIAENFRQLRAERGATWPQMAAQFDRDAAALPDVHAGPYRQLADWARHEHVTEVAGAELAAYAEAADRAEDEAYAEAMRRAEDEAYAEATRRAAEQAGEGSGPAERQDTTPDDAKPAPRKRTTTEKRPTRTA